MTLNLNVGVGINPDFLNYSLAERKIIINLGLLAYKELNTKIYSFSHNSKLEQSLTQKLDQEKEATSLKPSSIAVSVLSEAER